LDTVKNFAKEKINKVVDTIHDWKDAAVMIFKVILLIHYHALRLWIKNVPYFKKPEKPDANIS
jgi:DUF1365 family protein